MTTFDYDDDIRRDESDELHGHAGGWYDKDPTPAQGIERPGWAPPDPTTKVGAARGETW